MKRIKIITVLTSNRSQHGSDSTKFAKNVEEILHKFFTEHGYDVVKISYFIGFDNIVHFSENEHVECICDGCHVCLNRQPTVNIHGIDIVSCRKIVDNSNDIVTRLFYEIVSENCGAVILITATGIYGETPSLGLVNLVHRYAVLTHLQVFSLLPYPVIMIPIITVGSSNPQHYEFTIRIIRRIFSAMGIIVLPAIVKATYIEKYYEIINAKNKIEEIRNRENKIINKTIQLIMKILEGKKILEKNPYVILVQTGLRRRMSRSTTRTLFRKEVELYYRYGLHKRKTHNTYVKYSILAKVKANIIRIIQIVKIMKRIRKVVFLEY